MYANYTNEELRRVLATNPKDAEALVEAADRFLAIPAQEETLDGAYQEGYDQGYREGYDNGYAEGEREDDSR